MNPPARSPRRLGPFEVSPIGFGCMNLSWAYGPAVPEETAERVLLTALDAGVTLFDTAALYGFGANEALVGRILAPHRNRIVLCSKGGMTGEPVGPGGALQRVIDGRPASLRRHVEQSLGRLKTDRIDLYYLHRWDKAVPIEDSVGELSRAVERGEVRAIGLSEVSGSTLRRAHAVHPIAALQSEYSPWSREAEIGALEACRQIGAAYVAFSPVGRGALTHRPPSPAALAEGDIRRSMPRFAEAAWAQNQTLLAGFRSLAATAGCTPAQLALAWLLSRGPEVIPIPGTTRVEHLLDNLGASGITLEPATLAALDRLFPPGRPVGGRYSAASQAEVDTETWPG